LFHSLKCLFWFVKLYLTYSHTSIKNDFFLLFKSPNHLSAKKFENMTFNDLKQMWSQISFSASSLVQSIQLKNLEHTQKLRFSDVAHLVYDLEFDGLCILVRSEKLVQKMQSGFLEIRLDIRSEQFVTSPDDRVSIGPPRFHGIDLTTEWHIGVANKETSMVVGRGQVVDVNLKKEYRFRTDFYESVSLF